MPSHVSTQVPFIASPPLLAACIVGVILAGAMAGCVPTTPEQQAIDLAQRYAEGERPLRSTLTCDRSQEHGEAWTDVEALEVSHVSTNDDGSTVYWVNVDFTSEGNFFPGQITIVEKDGKQCVGGWNTVVTKW